MKKEEDVAMARGSANCASWETPSIFTGRYHSSAACNNATHRPRSSFHKNGFIPSNHPETRLFSLSALFLSFIAHGIHALQRICTSQKF